MAITANLKRMAPSRSGCFEKMLNEGVISKAQFGQLTDLREEWQAGNIPVGIVTTHREVEDEIQVSVPRSTLQSWLGRKG